MKRTVLPLLILLCVTSCAAVARVGSASLGAAVGSYLGPGGAAAGAASGLMIAETTIEKPDEAPTTAWGIFGDLLDKLGHLAWGLAILTLLLWWSPSPSALFKKLKGWFTAQVDQDTLPYDEPPLPRDDLDDQRPVGFRANKP